MTGEPDAPGRGALGRLEGVLLAVGAAAVLGLGVMITANVVGRALLGASLPDTVIIVRELMVAAIVLPLAAATAARSHVAVTFLADRMGRRGRSWLIVLGSVVGALALMPLLWAGWRELAHNWSTGGFFAGDLDLPRWPGRALFLVGMAFCWLRLVTLAWSDARTAADGGVVAPEPEPERARDGME